MIAWALQALLASTALMALVLVVRLPVRRAFGPMAAYALWAMPALRLMLPPLPAEALPPTAAPFADAGGHVMLLVLRVSAAEASSPLLGAALVLLWLAGATVVFAAHLIAYIRFSRRVTRNDTPIGRVGRIKLVEADAIRGPLAYGLLRPVVTVPRDFAARYDRDERRLALAHELAHHRHGDIWANGVALAVIALHWFDPLAWIAFRAFRMDQELANDARVLAAAPGERHAYARAIVKAACGSFPAAACGLHTINDVKGRLRMLATTNSHGRRAAGILAVAGVTIGLLGLTASGGRAAETVRTNIERATGMPLTALTPAALLREDVPAPPGPTALGSGGRHVATVRENGAVRVAVTENGRTRRYEGRAAEAWLAANPQPLPPAPPVAPIPPVPPAVGTQARTIVVRPGQDGTTTLMLGRSSVTAGAPLPPGIVLPRDLELPAGCGSNSKAPPPAVVIKGQNGDQTYTVLCTRPAASGAGVERDAYEQALVSLNTVRRSIATQPASATFPEAERVRALASVDRSIADITANLARTR